MRRAHLFLSGLAALTGALLLATPAAAIPPRVAFEADSGDACQYGYTKGALSMSALPTAAVVVSGVVIDRPTGPSVPETCPDDRRFSIATLVAFSGPKAVDAGRAVVDNGSAKYGFTLTIGGPTVGSIDRVTVQVCRQPREAAGPRVYCGATQTYRLPTSQADWTLR